MNAKVCWEVGVKANLSCGDGGESENFLLCTFQPNGTMKRHCCRLNAPLCEKHQNYRLPIKIAATCDGPFIIIAITNAGSP